MELGYISLLIRCNETYFNYGSRRVQINL